MVMHNSREQSKFYAKTICILIVLFVLLIRSFLSFVIKVASPLGGYKCVVTAEQMYGIIEQVHKHEVCHSGVFKTFKKVSFSIHYFIDLLFWSY